MAKKNRIIIAIIVSAFICYNVIVYTRKPGGPQILMSQEALAGEKLWQDYNCTACHQLYGLGGYLGPDLTNTISEKGEKYTEAFIRNGSNRMPKFDLSDDEIHALIELLKEIDSSGEFPILDFDVNWDGTIEKKNKK